MNNSIDGFSSTGDSVAVAEPVFPNGVATYTGDMRRQSFRMFPGDRLILEEVQTLTGDLKVNVPPSVATGFESELTFAEYQREARKTAIYGEAIDRMDLATCRRLLKLCYATLGLASEAGEVAGKVKKVIRDSDGNLSADKVEGILKELGGSIWYMADVATNLGACLGEDVARPNLIILESRAARGVLKGNGDNR